MKEISIALAGNPNSGKTSIFNELTGTSQYVGNWPGVTVEKKEGTWRKNKKVKIQDLPGIYSLSPYTPEEIVARDYLLHQQPEVILNVVDASNLERNLYLTTQLLETGIPVVVDLNMMDVVKKMGNRVNEEKLAYGLGTPVVCTSAVKGDGVEAAAEKAEKWAKDKTFSPTFPSYDRKLESALSEIEDFLPSTISSRQTRWYAIKLFERDTRVQAELSFSEEIQKEIEEIIQISEKIFADDSESILINERYEFIVKLVELCSTKKDSFKLTWSDKIDRIVTNRILAIPVFAFVMWLVYYISIQTIGTMGTDWINDTLFGTIIPNAATGAMVSLHIAGWMQALVLDGIIAGVGAVLGFLPQIATLFFCLAVLEDCGYMARIAFVMDRFFRKFGLSGKSFIPMLIATGCGVPAVMATRTIENEKDRRMTVMVTTFMPCSAKLPIIALIAGAFFPTSSWVAPSAYFIGIAAIVLSGIMLKKTALFSGDPAPFIMELPAYHMPRARGVLQQTWNRSVAFVKKAGTIIFVACILIWFMSSYNFQLKPVAEDVSILAAIGNVVAPLFAPLGWGNWRATVATVTGLIAKENVVGTFGILYGGMAEVSENGHEVWPMLQVAFTSVSGYSFLIFNLLCAPCFAAIGAIHREMITWKWTGIAIGYQCGLAYLVSFVVYQLGSWFFENNNFGLGQFLAIGVIGGIIYALVRKPRKKLDMAGVPSAI